MNNYVLKTIQVSLAALACITLPAMAQAPQLPNAQPTGTYTFSGTTELTALFGLVDATCELGLTGNVTNTTSPEGIYIDITGGSVTGSDPLCSQIDLVDFTSGQTGTPQAPGQWEAFAPDSAVPPASQPVGGTPLVVQSVHVQVPNFSLDCVGDVNATFFDGINAESDPSFFTFNDSFDGCTVVTLDPTGLEVQGGDVNVVY